MSEQAIKILCFALAEYARIEGMKALNAHRLQRGETVAYPEEDFLVSASVLEQLGREVINQ